MDRGRLEIVSCWNSDCDGGLGDGGGDSGGERLARGYVGGDVIYENGKGVRREICFLWSICLSACV